MSKKDHPERPALQQDTSITSKCISTTTTKKKEKKKKLKLCHGWQSTEFLGILWIVQCCIYFGKHNFSWFLKWWKAMETTLSKRLTDLTDLLNCVWFDFVFRETRARAVSSESMYTQTHVCCGSWTEPLLSSPLIRAWLRCASRHRGVCSYICEHKHTQTMKRSKFTSWLNSFYPINHAVNWLRFN